MSLQWDFVHLLLERNLKVLVSLQLSISVVDWKKSQLSIKSIKHLLHNIASLHIQKHFHFVSPQGAFGGGEFWLAGGGPILGNVALPDAVVTTTTCPQNQWPDNRGEGGWVCVCEDTDRVSDWERDKAIKTTLRWLSGSVGDLQVSFPTKASCVCVCVCVCVCLCVFASSSVFFHSTFKLPRGGNFSFYTLHELHGVVFMVNPNQLFTTTKLKINYI